MRRGIVSLLTSPGLLSSENQQFQTLAIDVTRIVGLPTCGAIGRNQDMKWPDGVVLIAILLTCRALLAASPLGPLTPRPLPSGEPRASILKSTAFKHYFDSFAADDQELYPGYITNGAAWDFLKNNIPLFECPDPDLERTYYFRWWTYRQHIQCTSDGFIISEFLPPVPWAGKDNSISCAAGHHLYEGRWLADSRYLDDYSLFWFRKGGEPRRYSFWAADALWARYLVTGNPRLPKELLPDLVNNYRAWTTNQLGDNGLFWQIDDRDGMEVSLGGSGYRPTINSYMYGDAVAIANIAQLAGQPELSVEYRARAATLKHLVEDKLWNAHDQFFEVVPRDANRFAGVRELLGFTPWYFNLPAPNKSIAWKQLMDPQGFLAPYGPTTAEQRNPRFAIAYTGHECQWNGPSWPYSTSVTLTALANLLHHYRQTFVTKRDFFDLLKIYTRSQRLMREHGSIVPWIDENLDPFSGTWIARTLLKQRGSAIPERGKDYNHSTYCDLIITGLIGLRPNAGNLVEVNPLVPDAQWDYFCLDHVLYHNHHLTILYDKTGERMHRGKGLSLFADGKLIARSKDLRRLSGTLPN